jgi:hypothetical protein
LVSPATDRARKKLATAAEGTKPERKRKRKSGLTPAGRARIAEAVKERWERRMAKKS